MALIKELELDNGIILNYHRVYALDKITNINNTIEVKSYLNKEQRIKEKEADENGVNLYTIIRHYSTAYDDNMTIEDAYEYLKTTDDFANADDDLEEDN